MKKTFKSFICIAMLIGLLSVFGCKFTEPSKPSDTMFIGQISLDAKGFQDYTYIFGSGDTSINGNKLADITLVLRNKESQKTYAATTDKWGAFYLFNPQPGSYMIEKLIYTHEVNKGWERINVSGINLPIIASLEPGKVYNFGQLHWNAWVDASKEQAGILQTLKSANSGLATLNQDSSSFDKLKGSFTQKLPKSRWLQKEWVNAEITPSSQPAGVKFDYHKTKDND